MKYYLINFFVLLFCSSLVYGQSTGHTDFNNDWKFFKGEVKDGQSPTLDDSKWRTVQIPHDWAIEGPFSKEYNARCGGLPFHGEGWYRKSFTLTNTQKGKHIAIEFEGVMKNSEVWINGHYLGKRPFGYLGFEYDLTPYLHQEGMNIIAVKAKPEDLSSRWYPGAGMYRKVWLNINNDIRVAHWGTFVTSTNVSAKVASVNIQLEIQNFKAADQIVSVVQTIKNNLGETVKELQHKTVAEGSKTINSQQSFNLIQPQLWTLTSPHLYQLETELKDKDGKILDRYTTKFGVRSIQFTANDGFFLNGKRTELKGVCLHHDLGPLGTAVNRRATERQLEIMKEMGVNAIRTSHNPPSREQLELCDEMGILVIDEAFDEWGIQKIENGYHTIFDEWHERDLTDMIRRDRNHPSIIMWSIGNEIREQKEKDGWKVALKLGEICHREDPSRPNTAGFNQYENSIKNKLAHHVDIVGFNYKAAKYAEIKENYPDWIVYGSETESITSSRGVYHTPFLEKYEKNTDHQVTSYDIIGPIWSYPPDMEFKFLEENPSILGEFMWTGFDYLGEPTPYGGRDNSTNGYWNDDWPNKSSFFGPVDLCGFKKDRFYLYQSQWTDTPMVHLLPHWNWKGFEGKEIPVFAYTNAESAELFLNGKSLGKKVKGVDKGIVPIKFSYYEGPYNYPSPYRLRWDVPYEKGELKVVAYNGDKVVSEKVINTTSKAKNIELTADRKIISSANGEDLVFVTARALDTEGHFCATYNGQIQFSVTGDGTFEATGNGDPASLILPENKKLKFFNGMALVIARANKGDGGKIIISATGKGLKKAQISVETKANPKEL
ncbi:glycoside hydrolase family 2 TIM barrel-domain containing protein [Flammeovirga sp. SubArs3]|uniref:glycoside hydrolase family 2 TIM barrel-domain containing protein n=1 Tax=Flammeovirga sp. SubArs3 TaxID=2995316 RepID=UPI00248D19BF|nr:glycoside hydrolase family 2 TIM barrel-domain containing protein [Flammeovirga sp. SubArs3]